jgi:hypothetical protein
MDAGHSSNGSQSGDTSDGDPPRPEHPSPPGATHGMSSGADAGDGDYGDMRLKGSRPGRAREREKRRAGREGGEGGEGREGRVRRAGRKERKERKGRGVKDGGGEREEREGWEEREEGEEREEREVRGGKGDGTASHMASSSSLPPVPTLSCPTFPPQTQPREGTPMSSGDDSSIDWCEQQKVILQPSPPSQLTGGASPSPRTLKGEEEDETGGERVGSDLLLGVPASPEASDSLGTLRLSTSEEEASHCEVNDFCCHRCGTWCTDRGLCTSCNVHSRMPIPCSPCPTCRAPCEGLSTLCPRCVDIVWALPDLCHWPLAHTGPETGVVKVVHIMWPHTGPVADVPVHSGGVGDVLAEAAARTQNHGGGWWSMGRSLPDGKANSRYDPGIRLLAGPEACTAGLRSSVDGDMFLYLGVAYLLGSGASGVPAFRRASGVDWVQELVRQRRLDGEASRRF